VLPAASALLRFAYEPRPRGRTLRRAEREVIQILTYAERVPPTQRAGSRLSENDLRLAHGEVRRLLFFLVLEEEIDVKNPRPATLRVRYWRRRGGPIEWSVIFQPIEVRVMVAALAVLADALPWLDRCALCGRVFFRVRAQRLCSRRCANVFHARRHSERAVRPEDKRGRKGDATKHPGRPRIDYMEKTAQLHASFPES
jgi:hypothetical protein